MMLACSPLNEKSFVSYFDTFVIFLKYLAVKPATLVNDSDYEAVFPELLENCLRGIPTHVFASP